MIYNVDADLIIIYERKSWPIHVLATDPIAITREITRYLAISKICIYKICKENSLTRSLKIEEIAFFAISAFAKKNHHERIFSSNFIYISYIYIDSPLLKFGRVVSKHRWRSHLERR